MVVDDDKSTGDLNHLEDDDHSPLLSPDNDHDGSFNHNHVIGAQHHDHVKYDHDVFGPEHHDDFVHGAEHHDDLVNGAEHHDDRGHDYDDRGAYDNDNDDSGLNDDHPAGRDDYDASSAAGVDRSFDDNDRSFSEHHDVVDPTGHGDHGVLRATDGSDDCPDAFERHHSFGST